jgi:DNA-binding transcriptional MocR family regulator
MPPCRSWARRLGVSRNTVLFAFEQLAADAVLPRARTALFRQKFTSMPARKVFRQLGKSDRPSFSFCPSSRASSRPCQWHSICQRILRSGGDSCS